MKSLFVIALSAVCLVTQGAEKGLVPKKVIIVGSAGGDFNVVDDLKKHLDFATKSDVQIVPAGGKIPSGCYPFVIGRAPTDRQLAQLANVVPEEGRWQVTKKGVFFWGHPRGVAKAVYACLEEDFGVRWPWGSEFAFPLPPSGKFTIVPGPEKVWKPKPGLCMRHIRTNRQPEAICFHERHRGGMHGAPSYGHAFTQYWYKYGQTRLHPDWFAMRSDGKRLPIGLSEQDAMDVTACQGKPAEYISMCVSNEGLVDQVVKDWLDKGAPDYINCCENDANPDSVCHCEKCKALDAPPPKDMKKWWNNSYADRYVNFIRRILAKARKHNPKVRAVFYAYNAMQAAPRREKLDDSIVVGLVPTEFTVEKIRAYVDSWKAVGMKEFFHRPNRHHQWHVPYFPMGWERHFFDIAQALMTYDGFLGFDYDSKEPMCLLDWYDDYMVFQAMQDPSKPFEYWEERHMQAFGKASKEIGLYYRYWREMFFEKRVKKDVMLLTDAGKCFNFGRGFLWRLPNYMKKADFDRSAKCLDAALAVKDLDPEDRRRIEALKVAHTHAKLTYLAMTEKSEKAAKDLFAYRKEHGFAPLPWYERYYGDLCCQLKYGLVEYHDTRKRGERR